MTLLLLRERERKEMTLIKHLQEVCASSLFHFDLRDVYFSLPVHSCFADTGSSSGQFESCIRHRRETSQHPKDVGC